MGWGVDVTGWIGWNAGKGLQQREGLTGQRIGSAGGHQQRAVAREQKGVSIHVILRPGWPPGYPSARLDRGDRAVQNRDPDGQTTRGRTATGGMQAGWAVAVQLTKPVAKV